MDAIEVPTLLDGLDDDTARFVGGDHVTVERPSLFGGMQELEGKFPVLWLSRDAWVDMGCPTMLMVKLSEVTTDDRSPL